MKTKVIIFLIIIVALVLIGYFTYKSRFKNVDISADCVCAFDLDNTLTCGIKQAADAVKACKEHHCKIAIVTARPTPWYSDIKLKELGLEEADFIDDFYHGEKFDCSFLDRECLEQAVSSTKVNHLRTLANKYNVDPDRIILFDDQHPNVQAALDTGFKAIHANHDLCGLPHNSYIRVKEHLHI